MKKTLVFGFLASLFLAIAFNSCKPSDANPSLTPYNLVIPTGLPAMTIPADNPLTEEGVALGRKLFYDPILSGNNTQSCGSCHRQAFAFSDSTTQFSTGIDHLKGTRNAGNLTNIGYQRKFFWDGGAADLESQVIGPIQNPIEMHEDLNEMLKKLNADKDYPTLFKQVFGGNTISTVMVMKAIAQFERTLISGNSKYDQYLRGQITLTAEELRGKDVFDAESKGDCTHCHSLGSTFSDFEYRNTGLDSIAIDLGRYRITLQPTDSGKFKTPSLRNIALTAPYMHDGRFNTLGECIDHYNTNFHYTKYLDGNLANKIKGRMSNQDKSDLIAFLNTLTDSEIIHNPKFAKP